MSTMTSSDVRRSLQTLADPTKAQFFKGFFKTGKGEYAEGDEFLGITVPLIRNTAKKFQALSFIEITKLLASKIHEHRLTALEILVMRYENAKKVEKLFTEKSKINNAKKEEAEVVLLYLKNTKHINNWDLVDLSASYILGDWLIDKDRAILYKLAKSANLWERRIAVISTFAFIKTGDFTDSLNLAKILLHDEHDLIHKAVGWMLREIGKKSEPTLCKFLDKNYDVMPRTMLRYSIERLQKSKREVFLSK